MNGTHQHPNVATREIIIPANGNTGIVREAEFLTCLEASAPFRLRLDQGPQMDFEAGLGLTVAEKFQRIDFINNTAEEIRIRVALGKGDIADARLVLSGTVDTRMTEPVQVSGVVDTRENGPDDFGGLSPISVPNGQSVQAFASDAKRVEAIVSLDATATGPVFLAGGMEGASIGVPVYPGQSFMLATSSPVYVRNDTGNAVQVFRAFVGRS